ncbi:ABC transporter ATP-binding protein [Virgisporangium aurantiacum]|uniref:Multidrug ABC transporter permease n=1 Tax=Virgisporangium aurantiacum TaxID=175570 RepID=A0A8J4E7E0_9ACTN|nr:ABC transporter ATP-binding protein [Virgisporangium aurantiacum]GIJ64194.1 multidrug ABC transporter permease [Virgisporangium aurantiacum]
MSARRTGARLPVGLVRLAELSLLCLRAGPRMYLGLLATALATSLLPLGAVWSTKRVIDAIASGQPAGALVWWSVLLVAVALVGAVEPHLSVLLDAELVRRVDRHVQRRLGEKVVSFAGLSRFENPDFLDGLRMATLATGSVLTPATTGLFSVVRSFLTLVSLLCALFVLSPVMAVVLVVAAVPALMAQALLSRQHIGMALALSPTNRRYVFYKALMTDVRAAKEVRLFGLGSFLQTRLLGALDRIHDGERRFEWRVARVQAALGLLGGVVAGAGLIWAVRAAAAGRFTAGDVSAFVAAVGGAQAALAALVGGIAGMHQALLMFGHHQHVMGLPDDLPARVDAVRPSSAPSRIEVRDVWFRYHDDHPWVLRGTSMTIPAGGTVALVGLNGAGKSTLIKLLCRFYDPTRGAILWDGVDIRDLPVDELRERIGVLFQDFMTYDLSVAENIGLGDLPALHDRRRVERAAHDAGIHEHIATLPRDYDTLLSRTFQPDDDDDEAGVLLSGGQWQRLALARTLMRGNRDLLILDEPTAGLDAEAEQWLHRRLARHRAGRTSLLVSHRLSAVREADTIVVLAAGRVVEQGTHAQLMTTGGRYANLFTLQAGGYRTTDAETETEVVRAAEPY